ncbi:ABC transporter [Akanthomyces lecanii RCEF 1005]|uniref:ABC transporter n=1 Tax=Akanthomyces lecanii RCEF 1005 TaxID=1081108 RepID=A0A168L305_CORDF|nr:ABC transporter [Akanthomyces lecanii RCEF 1005]
MKRWNEHIESRVSKTSQIVSQLPAIKMLGLGPKVAEYIQALRIRETDASKTFRSIRAGAIASASFCDLITPTTIVAAALFWGGFVGKFTPGVVYPVLALVAHVQEPLAALFYAIPGAKILVVYFSRVQDFLCLKEHEDPRKALEQSEIQVSPQSTLILFEEATVAPRGSATAVLKNIDLEIRPDSTTAVLGPTGSGKSTFIEAVLGEADLLEGQLFVGDIAIAFCGQTVYLPNTTIQECIVGHCEYVESWFNTVVEGCQLAEDLQRLPGGRNYVVGPGGMALSGGQRVRVSIARAVFSLAQLVVLDDSLSSLDGPTGRALLEALLGESGLFKQNHTAVVISSNMIDCVDFADQYVVLEDEGQVSVSTPGNDPEIRSRLEWLFRPESTGTSNDTGSAEKADGNQSPSNTTPESGPQDADNKLRQQGGLSLYSFWLKFAGRKVEVDISTASYETGSDQPLRPHVLKDVSFSIQPGTKVGIIGRSGSGKTSLLLSLLGFLEYDGSIKIDDVEIRDARRDELRSRIVTIAQDNVVLEGTIRQNLLPFDTELGEQPLGPVTEKQNAEAAQKDIILREVLVRLRIWDSLEEYGELDAVVGKVGYSHGELQMLCIARAVVHRRLTGSRLVLVDEGTSNVDRWRDVLVRRTLKQYFSDCTVIVIAHRDETIADASTTITLADGKVVRRR